jgi:hypothetical protein
MAAISLALAACATPLPPPPAPSPPREPSDASCGLPVPPPTPAELHEGPHVHIDVHPVPSFIAPRLDSEDIAPSVNPAAVVRPSGGLPDSDFDHLTEDQVQRVIYAHAGELRACLMHGGLPDIASIEARFSVLYDGSVAAVSIHGPEPVIGACVCGVVARARFPPDHGRTEVKFPIMAW